MSKTRFAVDREVKALRKAVSTLIETNHMLLKGLELAQENVDMIALFVKQRFNVEQLEVQPNA